MSAASEGAYKLGALKFSTIAIASVVVIEVLLGLLASSLAILSDGLHAVLDVMAGVMLYLATKASLKPPDEEHTYGHEKFESIGGLLGSIVLIGVSVFVIFEAIAKLLQGEGVNADFGFLGFIAIGYTFSIDILRMAIFRKATGSESSTVKAGFYHALADLSSTAIAFLGFGLSMVGFNQSDSLSSIVLGALLSYMSIKLARSSIKELSDAASEGLVQQLRREISAHEGVRGCRDLKVRKVGSKIFAECALQVSSLMSLDKAHGLASEIEEDLKKRFGNITIAIHIEPSEEEESVKQRIEQLAMVDDVSEVHDVATVYAGGKLYVTLHAYVDPHLSVEEAHKIAEEIEHRIQSGIKQLEHVSVHVEPYGSETQVQKIDEKELRDIIQTLTEQGEHEFYAKRIVTYGAEGKVYVNIDCCFAKKVALKKAHTTASRIEHAIKERFSNTVVTVHIEP
ncbi:MAG: cation-efflux pump [Candidatus Bathyarchaeia archaeon]